MRMALTVAAMGLLAVLSPALLQAAENHHPQQITVNGKNYDWPKSPVVVVLIDGGDPAYVNAALPQGLLPNFKKLMTEGFVCVAVGAMPSFTNPEQHLRHHWRAAFCPWNLREFLSEPGDWPGSHDGSTTVVAGR